MSILDRFLLTDRVAIVTGAGRGIGEACALAFAEAGARVVVGARTVEQIEDTAQKIRALGSQAVAVPCDVMDADQRAATVEAALKEFGRLDILVNNAGGWPPKGALDTTDKEFDAAFRFNVTSAFAMTRLAVPKMVESTGSGSIINIGSVAGRENSAGFVAYGTAKAALAFMTCQLAQDFAPKVRVNTIAVGSIKTEALKTILNEDIEREMVKRTPMDRLGEVEDISACALYLASPAASYVTGEIYGVNGGLTTLNFEMPRANL